MSHRHLCSSSFNFLCVLLCVWEEVTDEHNFTPQNIWIFFNKACQRKRSFRFIVLSFLQEVTDHWSLQLLEAKMWNLFTSYYLKQESTSFNPSFRKHWFAIRSTLRCGAHNSMWQSVNLIVFGHLEV